MTGEEDDSGFSDKGESIPGYVVSWPFSSRFLALVSSDSVPSDMKNDFWYGDSGMVLGTPLRESLGSTRRLSGPEVVVSLTRCCLGENCGTGGITAFGLSRTLYVNCEQGKNL